MKTLNKKQATVIAIVTILLASSLALAIETAAARPNIFNIGHKLMQASWMRMNGNITDWGETDVRGQLQTQTRSAIHQSQDTKQLTGATAMWTTNTSRSIQAVRAKENFTYSYYVARLPNASVTAVESTSGSYSISGTWNVSKITSTITVITNENGTVTKVHRDQDIIPSTATGELKIADNKFTLTLTNMDPLTGTIYRSLTRSWFNPFKMTDDTANNDVVTKTDVRTMVKSYRAMPGWGNFDTKMDFNNNYRVDIADISTVAAKI